MPQPRRRKQRKYTACDQCRRRKIQCDKAQPQCDWCFHHHVPCNYSQPVERHQDNSAESQDQEENTTRQESIARYKFNHISTFNGIPFFSSNGRKWIEQKTGEKIDFDQYFVLGPPWQVIPPLNLDPRSPSPSTPTPTVDLPEKTLVFSLLHRLKSAKLPILPSFLDPSLFEMTIAAAYHNQLSPTSSSPVTAKACVFSFLALVHIIFEHAPRDEITPADMISPVYQQQAMAVLPQIILAPATLDGLQAVMMLAACYQMSSGESHVIDMLVSAATRLIFQLHGNLNPCANPDSEHGPSALQNHIRNLFWICHLLDKELCLRTGAPPSLAESQCDLTITGDLARRGESPENHDFYFLAFIRLAIIQGRIHNQLYSPLALQQKGDSEILRSIRLLDMELEAWRLSLPEFLRPNMSSTTLSAKGRDHDPSINEYRMLFQVQWHFCMIIIHQASSRCLTWMEDHTTKINGLTSSLMISVQATRSLLLQVCNSELYLNNFNFRYALFYVSSAAITLFGSIVLRPLDTDSANDVLLLERLVTFMNTIRGLRLSFKTAASIDMMMPLLLELSRLANIAVAKANL